MTAEQILEVVMTRRMAAGLKVIIRDIDPVSGKPTGHIMTAYAKDAKQAEAWRAKARAAGTLVEG